MDLDNSSDNQQQGLFQTSSPAGIYTRFYSLPNFSPAQTPERVQPLVARRTQVVEQRHTRTLSSPAAEYSPQPCWPGPPFRSATTTRPMLRSTSLHSPLLPSGQFSRGATPVKETFSAGSFSRGATPIKDTYPTQRQFVFGSPATPKSVGCASMEIRDRSDSSEMEVSQTSPSLSPSWDKVRAALSNISLFKSSSDTPSSQGTGRHSEQTENEGAKVRGYGWEPGLTAVQAAATFKRGGGKKNSPTKTPDSPSKSETSSHAKLPSDSGGRSTNSPPKLTDSGDKLSASTPSIQLDKSAKKQIVKPPTPWTPDEEVSCCSCAMVLKLFSVIVVMLAAFTALLIYKQDASTSSSPFDFASIDAELLRNDMASQVFGQHIAMEVVPRAVEQYLNDLKSRMQVCAEEEDDVMDEQDEEDDENMDDTIDSQDSNMKEGKSDGNVNDKGGPGIKKGVSCSAPPLVLSFHGWTGVGKNFVSDIITSLFPAKTVTKFLVPYHFPHSHLDKMYASRVERWVVTNVTKNCVNFFIFDEMDKASPGVVTGIQNAISALAEQNSYKSPSIFLLLSNSFAISINQRAFQAMGSGHERQSLTIDNFSDLFNVSGPSEGDADWYKQLKSAGFITVTVPFLPLEKQHVIQCIRRDLVLKKLSTHSDIINKVLKELLFTKLKDTELQFSQTGCKRVSDKVHLVAFDT